MMKSRWPNKPFPQPSTGLTPELCTLASSGAVAALTPNSLDICVMSYAKRETTEITTKKGDGGFTPDLPPNNLSPNPQSL